MEQQLVEEKEKEEDVVERVMSLVFGELEGKEESAVRKMNSEEKEKMFVDLALKASQADRKEMELPVKDEQSFFYGETPFVSIWRLKQKVCSSLPSPNTFYDLGCGCGKVVLAIGLSFDWKAVCGIEILPKLSSLALQAKERLAQVIPREVRSPRLRDSLLARLEKISFVRGSFLEATPHHPDWATDQGQWAPDVIFACSTAFDDKTFDMLSRRAESVKVGCVVVTVSYPLKSAMFSKVAVEEWTMSWGKATVITHRKDHNRRAESSFLRGLGFQPRAKDKT